MIVVDFNAISSGNEEIFKTSLLSFLDDIAAEYDLKLSKLFVKDKFAEL